MDKARNEKRVAIIFYSVLSLALLSGFIMANSFHPGNWLTWLLAVFTGVAIGALLICIWTPVEKWFN